MSYEKNAIDIDKTLIIFGATGDLMKKKIAPALYYLHTHEGACPTKIIATGRSAYTDETYRAYVKEHLLAFLRDKGMQVDEGQKTDDVLEAWLLRFVYIQGDAADSALYAEIEEAIVGDTTVFLAVGCDKYQAIAAGFRPLVHTRNEKGGAILKQGTLHVVAEKPHGFNAASMHTVIDPLIEVFGRDTTLLIEHYAAKDIVQHIGTWRAEHTIEDIWNASHITRIDVELWETMGLTGRGPFYETVGALRDMGQNHCLQLLAAVCRDIHTGESTHEIQQARAAFLETLSHYTEDEAATRTQRYQAREYQEVAGVADGSQVETAFTAHLTLTGPRWGGVEVRMGSGKMTSEDSKKVTVYFKAGSPLESVCFSLQPYEGVIVRRRAGSSVAEDRNALPQSGSRIQYVGEYARIIQSSYSGGGSFFVTPREVAAMWAAVDSFVKSYANNRVALQIYTQGAQIALD